MSRLWTALLAAALTAGGAEAQEGPKIFISVDMEGIGGVGTGAMTSSGAALPVHSVKLAAP